MALTVVILLPLAGAAAVWALSGVGRVEPARRLGLGVAFWTLVATLATWTSFDPATAGFQFVTRLDWVAPFGASYHVGLDGLTMALVTLTAAFVPLALLSSWRVPHRAAAGFVALVLVFEAAALAAFAARDLLLFFVSTEVMTLAAAALLGVWGRQRRVHTALRLLLMHLVGSSLMLVATLWLAWRHQVASGFWTFSLPDLVALDLPAGVQIWLWPAFVAALSIRVPVLPLHTWWPDAVAQAPAPAGALLGSVFTTVGGYGLFRIVWPLLPEASALWAPWLALVAVAGIVHGAVVALAQTDIRRVVAYLSTSQMGLIVLGLCALTPQAAQGGAVQLVARGLWTGGVLLIVAMLAGRRGTTDIGEFGGLRHVVPGLSAMLLLMAMAAMGLPGTIGFVAVVTGLRGTLESPTLPYGRELAIVALAGVLLWSVVLLRVVVRVVAGPLTRDRNRGLRDLTRGEWMMLLPVGALIVVLGLWPAPLLTLVEPAARDATSGVTGRAGGAAP